VTDPAPEMGTWSVDGTNLVLTDADGEVDDTNPFGVVGDEIHVRITEEADPEDPEDLPMEYVAVLKKK
jgi:hypothetical protein